MALSIALPLSGIEAEHFYAIGMRLLYEQGLRTLNGIGPLSPSIGSESSGISSLTPSLESDLVSSNPTPNSTGPSSLANSTEESGQCERLSGIEEVSIIVSLPIRKLIGKKNEFRILYSNLFENSSVNPFR